MSNEKWGQIEPINSVIEGYRAIWQRLSGCNRKIAASEMESKADDTILTSTVRQYSNIANEWL